MVCEPNAHMCGQNCEPALCHLRTVRIPFATNQNLLVFCANTKRTGCARCPFHAPNVLCSPQVRRKLITRAPNIHRMRTAQRVSGVLVYTRFYTYILQSPYILYDANTTSPHQLIKFSVTNIFLKFEFRIMIVFSFNFWYSKKNFRRRNMFN